MGKAAMKATKATTAMKAMKGAKAMKAMKAKKVMRAMKAKKVSVIAKGTRARAAVFAGTKVKTYTGLKKDDLKKNKNGKIVSKAASAAAKRAYAGSVLKKWNDACKAARKALGVTGFVAIGGKTAAGRALYAKAKSLLAA